MRGPATRRGRAVLRIAPSLHHLAAARAAARRAGHDDDRRTAVVPVPAIATVAIAATVVAVTVVAVTRVAPTIWGIARIEIDRNATSISRVGVVHRIARRTVIRTRDLERARVRHGDQCIRHPRGNPRLRQYDQIVRVEREALSALEEPCFDD